MAATRARTEAGMPLNGLSTNREINGLSANREINVPPDGLSVNREINGGGQDSDVVEETAARNASDK